MDIVQHVGSLQRISVPFFFRQGKKLLGWAPPLPAQLPHPVALSNPQQDRLASDLAHLFPTSHTLLLPRRMSYGYGGASNGGGGGYGGG